MRERVPYGAELREISVGASPLGAAWPIVYGRLKVACPVVHLHVRNGLEIECAAIISIGEIDGVEKVWVEEEEVYPATKPWCRLEIMTGGCYQDKSRLLKHGSWYTALPGVAYIALVLTTSQAPISGVPRVTALVRGRKCGPSNTYTANPVWHLYDIITNERYGAKARVGGDWSALAAQVSVATALAVSDYGRVTSDDQAIRSLLQAMHGRIYHAGAVYLALDSAATNVGTASPDGPIRVLEDPQVRTSLHEMPNSVRGSYVDATSWTERQVVAQTEAATTGDERPRWLDIGRIPVTDYQDAMRIAKTALMRGRAASRALTLKCDASAWDCWPGTRITVDCPPISSLDCLVVRRVEEPDGAITLEVIPWSASDFDSGTYTAPPDPDPDTGSSDEIILIRDDFSGGGTTGAGDIGELGWTGGGTFSYPAEAGRVGVLEFNTTNWITLNSAVLSPPYSARVVAKAISGSPTVFTTGNLNVWHDGTFVNVGLSYTPFVRLQVNYGTWFEVTIIAVPEDPWTRLRVSIRAGENEVGTDRVGNVSIGNLAFRGGVGRLDLIEVAIKRA